MGGVLRQTKWPLDYRPDLSATHGSPHQLHRPVADQEMEFVVQAHQPEHQSPRSAGASRVLLLLLLIPAGWSAVRTVSPENLPRLQFSATRPALVFETLIFDRSSIEAELRPVISEEFYFRNEGNEPVRILELVPSCGCLKPTAVPSEIPPGETGRITIPVRTANEPAGNREYLVTVRYEDPNPREVTLTWKVQLPQKKILVEPRVLMVIGDVSSEDNYEITVSDFRSTHKQTPLRLSQLESAPGFISAEAAGQSVSESGTQTNLRVSFTADIPPGQHRGMISAFTTDPEYPVLQIPVIVGRPLKEESEEIRVSPQVARLVVQRSSPEQSQPTEVTVTTPLGWSPVKVNSWPAQIDAQLAPPRDSTSSIPADQESELQIRMRLTEEPPVGVEQGVISIDFQTASGPRLISFPVFIVRI